MYFNGKEDKHEQGVGFLVHQDILKSVVGCRPISSRLLTVRLRASLFNITVIQIYAPTSSYDDRDVDEFYRELQPLVDQTSKLDILVVQGDWNAKVGEYAEEGWEDKHGQGVGFLVHQDILKNVVGCRPISSRLMTVRLRTSHFNITIIQVYAPTSSYDDRDVDEFYRELQPLVDQTPKLENMQKKVGEMFVDLPAIRRLMTEFSSS